MTVYCFAKDGTPVDPKTVVIPRAKQVEILESLTGRKVVDGKTQKVERRSRV